MKFNDIPQITRAGYRINVSWRELEWHIERSVNTHKLDMNPDFQRGHVWTEAQQIAYVEWVLRGGHSGREIYCNCPGWMRSFVGPYQLVDGKQRLTAALRFIRNEIPAFGVLYREYEDKLPLSGIDFYWNVANLKTRAEVLQWYLDFNSGGVVHTAEELARVRRLLEDERANNDPAKIRP